MIKFKSKRELRPALHISFLAILSTLILSGNPASSTTWAAENPTWTHSAEPLDSVAALRPKGVLRPASSPRIAPTDLRIVARRIKKPRYMVPDVPVSSGEDYTIGGKDVLQITVFEEPDLSSKGTRVSIDGYITFPLIGRVRVGGMTTHGVERALTRRLGKDYLVNPQVSVHVLEYASKAVNVLGAVKNSGTLPLKGPSTLLEMLGRAGGVNVEAAGSTLTILRPLPGKGGVKNITINLNRLLKEGDLSQNIVLRNRDTVFVPQADQIFVFGEVAKPGPYKLRSSDVSVVEAITMAGGPTRLAAANRTRIVRVEGGKERVIRVNVDSIIRGDKSRDIRLRSGDIVVIPQTYF